MHECESCTACGGCGDCRSLTITQPEAAMLDRLSQLPFLPVVRSADSETPIFPDDTAHETSLALLCLEKKGLITLDYDQPLIGYDYASCASYPLHGSMALTARGQTVVELIAQQGFSD